MPAGILLLIAILAPPAATVVRGVVRGPDGQPAAQAEVWLIGSGTPVPPEERDAMQTKTDQEGRFALPLRSDAPYAWNFQITVFAFKPGAGIATAYIDARMPPLSTLALKLEATEPVKMRVVDPSGAPVQNASVSVSNLTARPNDGILMLPKFPPAPFRGLTDSHGDVTLELCRTLSWFTLNVETPEFGTQTISAHASLADSPLSLSPAGKVRGRLIAADPRLLAGVSIYIESELKVPGRRRRLSDKGQAEVRTAADGRFEAPALLAGDVRIRWVERTGEPPVFLPADVTGTLVPGETLELEVPVVGGARVFGTVAQEENGQPVPKAQVHLSIDSGRFVAWSRSVMTDDEGSYEVLIPPDGDRGRGSVQVGPLPPPWLPYSADRLRNRFPAAGGEQEMPSFVVKRGTNLTGTVVDANARPVPLAHVQAAAVDASRKHSRRVLVETDAQGSFSVGPMDPDLVVALMASDDARASAAALIVEPGKSRTGIVLRIEEGSMTEISGRLVNTEGKPIAHDHIHMDSGMDSGKWTCDAVAALQPISPESVMTDGQGRFTFPSRVPILGRYWIQTLSRQGYVRKRLLLEGSDLQPGKQMLEDIVLERE